MSAPVIVSYGAGTNSTAMLVGLVERGERVDAIVFADTGGERPETYAYVEMFSAWLVERGYPAIVTVMHEVGGVPETLADRCLRIERLPSIAYGYRACSQKHKRDPQNRWARHWQPALDSWAAGVPIVKCLGFDAGEPHRATRSDAANAADPTERKRYKLRYPLLEWRWDRESCVEAIERAGLPQPGKSSCFFCPMSKPREVLDLRDNAPDLFARALAIEDAGRPFYGTIKGLGSYFSWRELADADARQVKLLSWRDNDVPCDCYDGGEE